MSRRRMPGQIGVAAFFLASDDACQDIGESLLAGLNVATTRVTQIS